MSNNANQNQPNEHGIYLENQERFIEINGEQVLVTEEVYRAYKQPLWAEHKRKEREKRCVISNGKGGTKRCTMDCSACEDQRTGKVLSLDRSFEEYGIEPADLTDIEDIVAEKILLKELMKALAELDPDNRRIMELFANGMSERDIAADIGLSQKAINKRKTKLFAQLKERLKDFI